MVENSNCVGFYIFCSVIKEAVNNYLSLEHTALQTASKDIILFI